MSLRTGDWQMNENGTQFKLTISSVDPNRGLVLGKVEGYGELGGLWDETSRTITFSCPSIVEVAVPMGGTMPIAQRFYKGLLFSTPTNPAPGQDVVWTLAGFVQLPDLGDATRMGGNARRNVFGWFAQITEVV